MLAGFAILAGTKGLCSRAGRERSISATVVSRHLRLEHCSRADDRDEGQNDRRKSLVSHRLVSFKWRICQMENIEHESMSVNSIRLRATSKFKALIAVGVLYQR